MGRTPRKSDPVTEDILWKTALGKETPTSLKAIDTFPNQSTFRYKRSKKDIIKSELKISGASMIQ